MGPGMKHAQCPSYVGAPLPNKRDSTWILFILSHWTFIWDFFSYMPYWDLLARYNVIYQGPFLGVHVGERICPGCHCQCHLRRLGMKAKINVIMPRIIPPSPFGDGAKPILSLVMSCLQHLFKNVLRAYNKHITLFRSITTFRGTDNIL